MGILDDAIREHLDLKRRHGAPDVDIRQLEDEAFGESDLADPFAAAAAAAAVAAAPTDAPEESEVEEPSGTEQPVTPPPPGPATPAPEPGAALGDVENSFSDEPTTVAPALEPEWDTDAGLVAEADEVEQIFEPPEPEAAAEPPIAEPAADPEPAEPAGPYVPPPPPADAPASRPGGETARSVEPAAEQEPAPPEPPSDLLDRPDLLTPDESGQGHVPLDDADAEIDDAGGEFYDFATDADFAEPEPTPPLPDDPPSALAAEPPQAPAVPEGEAASELEQLNDDDEAELDGQDYGKDELELPLDVDELPDQGDQGDPGDQGDEDVAEGEGSDEDVAEGDQDAADAAEDGGDDADDADGDAPSSRVFADPEEDQDPLEQSSEFAPVEDDDSGELWFEQSEPEDFDFKD